VSQFREPAAAAGGVDTGSKGRLCVGLEDSAFAGAVVADLNRIRRTTAGRALFRGLAEAGCTVNVVKPSPPTDPPNAWTLRPAAGGDRDVPIVVVYDPADWPGPSELGGLPSDMILFGRLQHALAIAVGAPNLVDADEAVSPAMAAYLRERTVAPEPAVGEGP
jgi:hypothetical protein